ncbi:hypothetical protein NPIL_648421 [Nephila pilipes]|uniref:Uncharacterized protein n=1 Tax=Nephila pilipes TaxID=299642 RepID=A0A8X6TX49_NEPPI|nr:hypothetical protein NPIL_648421 [Nephila pilipes]
MKVLVLLSLATLACASVYDLPVVVEHDAHHYEEIPVTTTLSRKSWSITPAESTTDPMEWESTTPNCTMHLNKLTTEVKKDRFSLRKTGFEETPRDLDLMKRRKKKRNRCILS